jgi:hypothetical protein
MSLDNRFAITNPYDQTISQEIDSNIVRTRLTEH